MVAALLLPAASDVAAQTPAPHGGGASVTVSFTGLRSPKGLLRGCLTRNPAAFPDGCDKDPHSLKATIPATVNARMQFPGVPEGDYALSILHDQNANARLDTMMGIPREGVGFSENPTLRFSAPKFASARFHVGQADISKEVRLKYFL